MASARGHAYRGKTPGAGLTLAALLLASGAQGADPSDAATAQFDFGLREMLAGRYETGCPALDASYRADPRPGSLFTLAECEAKWGRTASALGRYDEYLALYERMSEELKKKQGERAQIAAAQHKALAAQAPRLTVRLPDGAPAGTQVALDDVPLSGPMLNLAAPVDPGAHVVRVRLADGRVRDEALTLGNGEQRSVVAELPASPPPATSTPPTPPLGAPPTPPKEAKPASHAGWAWLATGIGVAGAITGGVSGGVALGKRSTADATCDPSGACTTARGVDAGNAARSWAEAETVGLGVGAAGLVAALVLWLTEPRARPPRAARANEGPRARLVVSPGSAPQAGLAVTW